MRKRKLLCFAAALALLAAAAMPAWAAEQAPEGKTWQVDWRDDVLETRSEFSFGKFQQKTIHAAEAHVTLFCSAQKLSVGNAVLITASLGRATAGVRNDYDVTISTPQGVRLAPAAPTVDIFPVDRPPGQPEITRSGFVYIFGRPGSSDDTIRLTLPAGRLGDAQVGNNQWWIAEFTEAGEHSFIVTVYKNGRVVEQETIMVPVSPGRGSWEAKWDFQPFGVSLGAPGARNAQEARAYLTRGIAAAQVSFQATGDLAFEPAGTFDVPLDGTPVWTRLVATANSEMPTGRAEMVTTISKKPVSEFSYSVGYRGSLLPQVSLHNLPTPPGGPGPGPGGFGWYWPALPVAAAGAAPIVFGWVLGRRSVNVWLEPAGGGRVLVRRGRRGGGRVRAVVAFDTGQGPTATRELVLARNETQEIQAPEGWRAAELSTPGKRNKGAPTRLERQAA